MPPHFDSGMSEMGQTLPMVSARVPPDVRCCSKSDHLRRECEMTLRASSELMHRSKNVSPSACLILMHINPHSPDGSAILSAFEAVVV